MKLFKSTYQKWIFYFLFLFGGWNSGISQFWSPQNIQDRYKTSMIIRNYRELKMVSAELNRFIHIERLRIDGDVDVNTVSQLVSKMPWVDELQLIQFQGIISDVDLKNLEWVPSIYLYVPKDREDALLLNDQWKNIANVTLQFQEVPEQWDFMKGWKNCQSLTVLATMSKSDAENLLKQVVVSIPNIKRLGLSLASIKQIPTSIKNLNSLKEITIINAADVEIKNPDAQGTQMNNSDVLLGLVYSDLGRETIPVEIRSKNVAVSRGDTRTGDQVVEEIHIPIFVPFHYVAADPKLLSSDLKYIYELFPNSPKDPNFSWITEENTTIDFVEFTELKREKLSAKYGIQKQAFVNDYNDGIYEFEGNANNDETFYGEGKWAVLVPKNALIPKLSLKNIEKKFASENANVSSKNASIAMATWKQDYRLIVKASQSAERNAALGRSFQYDSTGKLYLLDAGVWFEISATSLDGDIDLEVRPGYFLQINYQASVRDSSRFYAFNIPRKKWVNYYDYDYDFDDEFVAKIDFYQFNQGANTAKKHSENDVLSLDEIFESAGYHYLLSPTELKSQLIPVKGNYIQKSVTPPSSGASFPLFRGRSNVRVRVLGALKMTDVVGIEISDVSMGKLFPELGSFEGFVFYIQTKASRKYVVDFFKSQRIVDVRIKKYGDHPQLEFKTDQWILELSCMGYKNLSVYGVTSSEQLALQKKWDQKFVQYQNRRNLKNLYWLNWRNNQENLGMQKTAETVFGTTKPLAGYKRGSMKVRSMGEFVMAKPSAMNPTHYLEIVFCDAGKIPLKCTDVLVVLDQPQSALKLENPNKNATSATDAPRYKLNINPKQISTILVKTQQGQVFYMTGDAFRKLNLMDNSISYVSLQPLPDKVYNSEILSDQLGIKPKKQKTIPKTQ